MKLTKGRLLETIRTLNEGASKYQARKIAGISKQRVYQIWNEYLTTGELPKIGPGNGRPQSFVTDRERSLVRTAYEQYRVSASTLERLIERDHNVHIGHNRVHNILIELGFAKRKAVRDKRKKNWIRYQRKYSLTAIHIDWHQRPNDGLWVLAIIDDASRKMLVVIEGDSPTTDESIRGMELALRHGQIKQCISDHGCQFTTNNGGDSRFRNWLNDNDIKQILCRIKHPQSNGKVEKWFQIYERHRNAFTTLNDFLHWYNAVRPHRSLRFDELETPNMAFERKKRAEA